MASIQGIYIALFGRPADPAGLAFFNTATKNGADLGAIGNLAGTAEYQSRFAGQTNEQIVNSIYQSLFGRAGEASGVSFWVSQLQSGRFNINNIAIAILDGAQGNDLTLVNAKIAAANIFTTRLDLPAEISAYVGNTAAGIGRDYISSITTTNGGTNDNADTAIARLLNQGGQTPAAGGDVGGGGGPVNTPATFEGTDKGTVKEDGRSLEIPEKPPEAVIERLTEESDGLQTASGTLKVTDPDAGQAGMQAATVEGRYGSLTINAAGEWTYTLNNNAENVQALKGSQEVTDAIVVRSIDGTAHTITITVQGTNDNAQFSGENTGVVKEDGEVLTTSGKLTVSDVDTGEASFKAAEKVAGSYGTLSIDANGNWTYTLDNKNVDVQKLGEVGTLTDKLIVESLDGTARDIPVTINGTNDPAEIGGTIVGAVTEDNKELSRTSGTLTISDVDTNEASFQATDEALIAGKYGSLTITSNGEWTYTIDNSKTEVQALAKGVTAEDVIDVKALDGTVQKITVTVTGTNDTATFSGADAGSVTEDAKDLTTKGTLTVNDADNGEVGFQAAENVAGKYGSLSIDATGNWTYTLDNTNTTVQALGKNVKIEDTIAVKSFDGTTKDIKVAIVGTNDESSITGTTAGDVAEDGTAKASGKLDVADIDSGENSTISIMQKKVYGTFNIDTNGNWTYDINNDAAQSLKQDEKVIETFTVFSADSGASKDVNVTITGKNDAATFSGDNKGNVTEDLVTSVKGLLKVADVDVGEANFKAATAVAGTYGSLAIDANGNWTYTLDNNKKAVQELAGGTTASDKIKVASVDGTEHTIEVTVTGVNDVAVIGGTKTGTVTEDNATSKATGTLTVNDADKDQSSFVAQTDSVGKYGKLSLAADGKWTYTLDNNLEAVNKLKGTDKVEDSFTVASKDGTLETIKIAVNGTNDAPTGPITGALTGGTEDAAYSVSKTTLLSGFSDAEGDTIDIKGAVTATNATVTKNQDGSYAVKFNADYTGDVTLTYTVTDGAKDVTVTKTIAVSPVDANDFDSLGTPGKQSQVHYSETTVYGGSGDDVLTVINSSDAKIYGGSGDDTLTGSFGNDKLYGGSGNDSLDGRYGSNELWGGVGNDKFIVGEGTDTIMDWNKGDKIDVSWMDAHLGRFGNQDFSFKEKDQNVGTAQISYKWVGGNTIVYADQGNGDFDVVKIIGEKTLTESDFVL